MFNPSSKTAYKVNADCTGFYKFNTIGVGLTCRTICKLLIFHFEFRYQYSSVIVLDAPTQQLTASFQLSCTGLFRCYINTTKLHFSSSLKPIIEFPWQYTSTYCGNVSPKKCGIINASSNWNIGLHLATLGCWKTTHIWYNRLLQVMFTPDGLQSSLQFVIPHDQLYAQNTRSALAGVFQRNCHSFSFVSSVRVFPS